MSKELNKEQMDLLEKGIISIRGDIGGDTLEYIELCMVQLAIMDNPDIEIWFASDGGDIDVGLCIFDIIRLYPGVVTGYVLSYAHSTAAIILQACDYRVAHPSSRMIIHDCTFTKTFNYHEARKGTFPEKFIIAAQDPQKRIISILSDVMGITAQEIRKILRKGEVLSAKEARKMRLLDEVL